MCYAWRPIGTIKLTSMDAINIIQNDFLDVLFDNRNKDYGAYNLRRYYERRMRNAVGITAGILLVMTGAYVVSNIMAKSHPAELAAVRPKVTTLTEIPVAPAEKLVAPPPPAAAAPAPRALKPMIQNTPPAVVPDDTKDITPPPTQKEMEGKVIGSVTTPGDVNGADIDAPVDLAGAGGGIVHAPATTEGSNDHPITFVAQMPSFPGGEEALAKFLRNNVRYPSIAQENGIQGIVSVQFVVTTDGTIQGVKVVGATHGGDLEDEALRVVRKMPKWKPGRQNGRDVAVYFTLPIRFVMQDQ